MNELGESAEGKITFKKFKELMKPDNVDEELLEKYSSLMVDSDKWKKLIWKKNKTDKKDFYLKKHYYD